MSSRMFEMKFSGGHGSPPLLVTFSLFFVSTFTIQLSTFTSSLFIIHYIIPSQSFGTGASISITSFVTGWVNLQYLQTSA